MSLLHMQGGITMAFELCIGEVADEKVTPQEGN